MNKHKERMSERKRGEMEVRKKRESEREREWQRLVGALGDLGKPNLLPQAWRAR